MTGITGAALADYSGVEAAVTRIKRHTDLPIAVGFGVKTEETAQAVARAADGVVVGTALVSALKDSLDAQNRASPQSVASVSELVAALAAATHGARSGKPGKGEGLGWLRRFLGRNAS